MHLPSLTLRPRLRAATLTLAALLAAAACGNKATSEAEVPDVPNVPVTGRVTDPNGLPLANVAVSAGNGAASATTDADGRYALGVAAAKLSPQAVRFTAAKYATVGRRLGQQSATLDVVMRPYDVVQSIELPTGDANAVAATSVRGDGTLTLSIPSDSMVTAAGTPARGPAEVRLTYWNPMQDLAQAPASLATALSDEPNAPVLSLRTLGMASIEVAQGNDLLQVAPGRTLQLDHLLPEAFKLAMAQRPNDSLFVPYLFSYDMNTGLWALEGNLSYDAGTGTLRGELPHLSTWNYDNFENFVPPAHCSASDIQYGVNGCDKPENGINLGGCMAGTVQDGKGGVLANQPVRVWLFDNEHINAIDVTTDGSGRYCVDAGIRYCVPWGDDAGCKYTENTISYHVSSPASSDNSSMANPIPANCKQNGGSYSTIWNVNDCSLVKDASSGQGGRNPPVAPVQTASIGACGFCDGRGPGYCAIPGASSSGSCAQLPPVTFTPGKPPTGSTPPTTTAPKPTPKPMCTKTLEAGEACSLATIQTICCKPGYECADRVCVPVSAE